jgi:hypothetical protein
MDEAVANGNWDGFDVRQLLEEEGADQILEHRRTLAKENGMDQTLTVGNIQGQPFRWKDKVFRIMRCDYVGGQAVVEVVPHDEEFVAAVKKRVEQDRFHTLAYYQGFGFICFPEDYQKYN